MTSETPFVMYILAVKTQNLRLKLFLFFNLCLFHMIVCLYNKQTHHLLYHCGEMVEVRLLLVEGTGCAARLKNRVHKGADKLDVDVNLDKQLVAGVHKCLGQVELVLLQLDCWSGCCCWCCLYY